jgi:hypothetical protein
MSQPQSPTAVFERSSKHYKFKKALNSERAANHSAQRVVMSLFQAKVDASHSKKPSGVTRETKFAKRKGDSEPERGTSGILRKEVFSRGEDRFLDLRLCLSYLKNRHEEFLGVTAKDTCIHFGRPEF